MGTKSRGTIFGPSIRASAERAAAARKEADRLACDAWNKRMLGYRGPAQPSPTLGDALNAGFLCLEVRCLGCDTHQTVALDMVRRPRPRRSTSLNANAFSIHAQRQGSSRGQDRGPQITLACRMSLTSSGE